MITANRQTQKQAHNFRWWVRRFFIGLFALLMVLLLVIFAAGTLAKASIRASYPPPGQMVDIGGYHLHLNCQGASSGPTVVIDAGQGDYSLSYTALQPQLTPYARVCTYDRAGLGWSDSSPLPRTASSIVAELHTLLQRAGIAGPYVLMGQSTGGLHVRLYAYTYPEEVAGLVLLDSASEEQFATNPELLDAMVRFMPLYYGVTQAVIWLGLPALRPEIVPGIYVPASMPQTLASQYRALATISPKSVRATSQELANLQATHTELREARARGLGNIPVVLLTHEHCNGCGMLKPEQLEPYEQNWLAQQAAVAAQSRRGRWQIAEGSGHEVHLDRPDLVIAAVREVLAAAKEE